MKNLSVRQLQVHMYMATPQHVKQQIQHTGKNVNKTVRKVSLTKNSFLHKKYPEYDMFSLVLQFHINYTYL